MSSDSEKSGSVVGGMLLVTGCCVGAGMLGLPIVTGLSGFFPFLIVFIAAWLFMTFTGLLLVEVNGWFSKQVNLLSMAGHTLGRLGKGLCWVLYLSLFYAVLVAYIAGSGSLFSSFCNSLFSLSFPAWAGALFFVLLFGWFIFLGTRPVDLWNRLLMIGKIFAFVFVIGLGVKYLQPSLLLRANVSYAPFALPILVIAFGFQNIIPSLSGYMKGDVKKVRLSILGGSLLAMTIYLLWVLISLSIIPMDGKWGIIESYRNGHEASQAIAGIVGSSSLGVFAQFLGFFAILTSFLAQALALVHFLADGFNIKSEKKENVWLCLLALAPPLVLSVLYPNLFFKALNFAGGICAVILFGLMPVAMVWLGRYKKQIEAPYRVKGGKPLLVTLFLFACFIIFFQLSDMFGAPYIPTP